LQGEIIVAPKAQTDFQKSLLKAVAGTILSYQFGPAASKFDGTVIEFVTAIFNKRRGTGSSEIEEIKQVCEKMTVNVSSELRHFFSIEAPNIEFDAAVHVLQDEMQAVGPRGFAAQGLDSEALAARLTLGDNKVAAFNEDTSSFYRILCSALAKQLCLHAREFQHISLELDKRHWQILHEMLTILKLHDEKLSAALREFEARFLSGTSRYCNKMQLLGLQNYDEVNYHYPLREAYVTLHLGTSNERLTGAEFLGHLGRGRTRAAFVRGEAGSGKSTLLRWLALNSEIHHVWGDVIRPDERWADSTSALIPIYVELQRTKGSIYDRLIGTLNRLQLPQIQGQKWLEHVLGNRVCLILLDGLDELVGESARDLVCAMDSFRQEYRNHFTILSGRFDLGAEKLLLHYGIPIYTLQELDLADRKALIERWYREAMLDVSLHRLLGMEDAVGIVEALGKKLLSHIETDPPLWGLTTNPFLCAATCFLYCKTRGLLEAKVNRLFQDLTDTLLYHRDRARNMTGRHDDFISSLALHERRDLVVQLAGAIVTDSGDGPSEKSIETRQAEVIFDDWLSRMNPRKPTEPNGVERKSALNHFVVRSGVMRAEGAGYGFMHNQFKEFFAAKALCQRQAFGKLASFSRDPAGRPILFFAAGESEPAAVMLFNRLKPRPKNWSVMAARSMQLPAVVCGYWAPSFPSALQTERDALLKQLTPPMSEDEAHILSAAGDVVVPLLKYKGNLGAKKSRACAIALKRVGSPLARQTVVTFHKCRDLQTIWHLIDFIEDTSDFDAVRDLLFTTRRSEQYTFLLGAKFRTLAWLPSIAKEVAGLNVSATAVKDWSPLGRIRGLRKLVVDQSKNVNSIPANATSELEGFSAKYSDLSDSSVIAGMAPIEELWLGGSRLRDAKFLDGKSRIKLLDLSRLNLADLTPLTHCGSLEVLRVAGTVGGKWPALSTFGELKYLALHGSNYLETQKLGTLPALEALSLGRVSRDDLHALSAIRSLRYLELRESHLDDIPVNNRLWSLGFKGGPSTDFRKLREFEGLKEAYIFIESEALRLQLTDSLYLYGGQNDVSVFAVTAVGPDEYLRHGLGAGAAYTPNILFDLWRHRGIRF
jgi:hypothetical protein